MGWRWCGLIKLHGLGGYLNHSSSSSSSSGWPAWIGLRSRQGKSDHPCARKQRGTSAAPGSTDRIRRSSSSTQKLRTFVDAAAALLVWLGLVSGGGWSCGEITFGCFPLPSGTGPTPTRGGASSACLPPRHIWPPWCGRGCGEGEARWQQRRKRGGGDGGGGERVGAEGRWPDLSAQAV